MKRIFQYILLCTFLGSVAFFQSCNTNQDYLTEGGRVTFSTDTVFFDTVFTALKSSTRIVKVYNNEDAAVKVNVFLKENTGSSFRINVDGKGGVEAKEVRILANDSATVFINAMIDETAEDTAFVIQDELMVQVNAEEFQIPVIAFAQNAHYLYDSILTTTTFTNDRPYVIIKNALVSEGHTLNVEPGTKIYMHQNSRLFIQGSLNINGTLEEPVLMQSDRIDRDVLVGSDNDMPGEWGGIYFLESSHSNTINYAVIKNGGLSTRIGESMTMPAMIQVDKSSPLETTPKLTMTNTVIKNAVQYGILSFGGSIKAENCVIVNAQLIAMALLEGGDYEFNDCTIGIFGGIPHFGRGIESASILVQNYYETSPGAYVGKGLNLSMNNCIVSGSYENEFITNAKDDFPMAVTMRNCVIKQKEEIASYVSQFDCVYNMLPGFVDPSKSDFHLLESSSLIGRGVLAGTINSDLDGVTRLNPPSIGAYEYQPGE